MIVSYDPWYFCDLSCNFFLYSNFTDLSPLPFFHSEEKDKDLSFFFYLFKEQEFSFIDLYDWVFFCLYFIYFCSDFMRSFLLLILGFVGSLYRCFRCKVRLFI